MGCVRLPALRFPLRPTVAAIACIESVGGVLESVRFQATVRIMVSRALHGKGCLWTRRMRRVSTCGYLYMSIVYIV